MICANCKSTNVVEMNVSLNISYLVESSDPSPKNIEYTGETEYGELSDAINFHCCDCEVETWPEDRITGANAVLAWAVGHRTKAYQCTCTVTKECVICKIVRREWTEEDGAEFLEDEDELA